MDSKSNQNVLKTDQNGKIWNSTKCFQKNGEEVNEANSVYYPRQAAFFANEILPSLLLSAMCSHE